MNEIFEILKDRIESLNLEESIIYPLAIIDNISTLNNILAGKQAFWSINLINIIPATRTLGRTTFTYEVEIARHSSFNLSTLNDVFKELVEILEQLLKIFYKDRTLNDIALISSIEGINFEQTIFVEKYSMLTGKLKLKIERTQNI